MALSFKQARRIVEHAEQCFISGVRYADPFEPFRLGGAADRDEALLALLLVIADFNMTVRCRNRDRGGFEAYVASCRAIAAGLASNVMPDHVDMTATRERSPSAFDSFVHWLELEDVHAINHWDRVNQWLSNVPAGSEPLLPSLIDGMDMDDLSAIVGCPYQLPSDNDSKETGYVVTRYSGSRAGYVTNRAKGVSVLVEDGYVGCVFLYFNRRDGYANFHRQGSGNLDARSRRRHVRKFMGTPDSTDGISLRYNCGRYVTRFEFSPWLGVLKMITMDRVAS